MVLSSLRTGRKTRPVLFCVFYIKISVVLPLLMPQISTCINRSLFFIPLRRVYLCCFHIFKPRLVLYIVMEWTGSTAAYIDKSTCICGNVVWYMYNNCWLSSIHYPSVWLQIPFPFPCGLNHWKFQLPGRRRVLVAKIVEEKYDTHLQTNNPFIQEYGYFSGETHLQAVCRFSHNIVEKNFVIED